MENGNLLQEICPVKFVAYTSLWSLRLSSFACKICVVRREGRQTGVYAAETRRALGLLAKVTMSEVN